MQEFKAGFVSIIGRPNAGKSTLLNAVLKEKLAIVSPKVQTTRHRIMGILNEPEYQVVFSDTPGILEPEYNMHQRMMAQVKHSLKDADVVLYLIDAQDKLSETLPIIKNFKVKVPTLLVLNKIDKVSEDHVQKQLSEAQAELNPTHTFTISALKEEGIDALLKCVVDLMPEHLPYFSEDDISDRPMKFFVSELIREQLFFELSEELPYHSAVMVEQYQDKNTLTKIVASIIVSRETQKAIVLGKGGAMIKKIGSQARVRIEEFIDRKVFLELHVKVRPDWRSKDLYLNEYGY
jgi:GTP-binding protein Era